MPPASPAPSPFSDPQAVARYAQNARRLVPGLDALHRMTAVLLAEAVPPEGSVLVLGAGGGLELAHLAAAHPGWTFDGVDPSREMLRLAERTLGPQAARVRLHEGTIDDAGPGPWDGAACLLTLHFLERGERSRTLRELHRRLSPGAPLVVAHHSVPTGAARDAWLERFAGYAVASGAPAERADGARSGIAERLPILDPSEDERVLGEAGFSDVGLFYAALTFRGWVARA